VTQPQTQIAATCSATSRHLEPPPGSQQPPTDPREQDAIPGRVSHGELLAGSDARPPRSSHRPSDQVPPASPVCACTCCCPPLFACSLSDARSHWPWLPYRTCAHPMTVPLGGGAALLQAGSKPAIDFITLWSVLLCNIESRLLLGAEEDKRRKCGRRSGVNNGSSVEALMELLYVSVELSCLVEFPKGPECGASSKC
jgi:hypothetical protein